MLAVLLQLFSYSTLNLSAVTLFAWAMTQICIFVYKMFNEMKCFKTLTPIQHVLGCWIQAF